MIFNHALGSNAEDSLVFFILASLRQGRGLSDDDLKSFHLHLRGIPYLTSIKQYNSKDSRFVYTDFSWCLDVATVPYTAKLIECPRGLLDSS